jgi:hypothetical protein
MAANVSLLTLRTRVRQRTHYENSTFVTDAELNSWINDSYRELYDWLTATFDAYAVSQTDNVISSANTFALPSDFYKLLGVDLLISAPDQYQTLPRIQFSDRNTAARGYELRGPNVVIYPYSTAAGHTYRLFYVPTPTVLTADGDTLDGIDGFDELIVLDTCLKVVAKSSEDPSLFAAQKQAMLDRVGAMAAGRDAAEPMHTTDVRLNAYPGTLVGGRYLWDIF